MKQKGSAAVKGSLWNHLDKKVLLWHREAPLFLRVYVNIHRLLADHWLAPSFLHCDRMCLSKLFKTKVIIS